MAATRKRKEKDPNGLCVGDRVTFDWGGTEVEGSIVEERGPLGIGGRRLYRIVAPMDPAEPLNLELAAEEFKKIG